MHSNFWQRSWLNATFLMKSESGNYVKPWFWPIPRPFSLKSKKRKLQSSLAKIRKMDSLGKIWKFVLSKQSLLYFQTLFYFILITQKAHRTRTCILKGMGVGIQKKPEYREETTNLGRATTTLPHANPWNGKRAAAVASLSLIPVLSYRAQLNTNKKYLKKR